MKTIENTLVELGTYLKDKVVAGDYELKTKEAYVAVILIDGFEFKLWIDGLRDFKFWDYSSNKMLINRCIFSEEEKQIAYDIIKPKIDKYLIDTLIAEKTKELEYLKNSLTVKI